MGLAVQGSTNAEKASLHRYQRPIRKGFIATAQAPVLWVQHKHTELHIPGEEESICRQYTYGKMTSLWYVFLIQQLPCPPTKHAVCFPLACYRSLDSIPKSLSPSCDLKTLTTEHHYHKGQDRRPEASKLWLQCSASQNLLSHPTEWHAVL